MMHPITGRPLTVTFKVLENAQFRRRGFDVFTNVFVPYSLAVLGGTHTISSLCGGEIQVQIPAGTESDTNIRLIGKGIQKKDVNGNGDHVLVIKIKVPKHLSEKQKTMLAAFSTLENHPVLEPRNLQAKRSQNEAFLMAKKTNSKSKSMNKDLNKPVY